MQRSCPCTHSSMSAFARERVRVDPMSRLGSRATMYGAAGSSAKLCYAYAFCVCFEDPPDDVVKILSRWVSSSDVNTRSCCESLGISLTNVSVIFKRRSGLALMSRFGRIRSSSRSLHQGQPKEARCLICDLRTRYEYPPGWNRPSCTANGPFRQGSQRDGGIGGSLGLDAILALRRRSCASRLLRVMGDWGSEVQ